MLTIKVYGPAPEMEALAKLLAHVPSGSIEVIIKAPLRNAVDRRPCQQPNWLIYDASIDNKVFINLVQRTPTSAYEITITTL